MISELLSLVTYLVESCTGVVLVESYEVNQQHQDRRVNEPLIGDRSLRSSPRDVLQDFSEFDQNDCIFQEFDPPENQAEADPKAWRKSVPPLKKSLEECLKTVLFIQAVFGCFIGFVIIGIEFVDFAFAEWCYDKNEHWNDMPKNVQVLRLTTKCVEVAFVNMWNITCMAAIFPFSLVKKLHLVYITVLAIFTDISYRLYIQMLGKYMAFWVSYPANAIFTTVLLVNNYLLARHFYPESMKSTLKLNFILSAQFLLSQPIGLFIFHVGIPWYLTQNEHVKVVIASIAPLLTVIPKLVCRLGAQRLRGVIHPGNAHVLVITVYAPFAVSFRLLQSELKGFSWFVLLGIVHASIDLFERMSITMRDQIWEYLYRLLSSLVRRQRPMPKYRSPRSRRFIADLSIQIMLHETAGLVSVLGFMTVYQALYTREKPFLDYKIVMELFKRASAGLLIDLFFNTISLLIQTRLMNIAVCRVWKKKWRSHVVVNGLILMISVIYSCRHVFDIVQDKYDTVHQSRNCSFPDFL